MKSLLFLPLSFCIIFLSSCSSNDNKTSTTSNKSDENTSAKTKNQETPLLATKWKLIELMGQTVSDSGIQQSGFLQLESDNKFSSSAGCNRILGTYELNPDMMRIEFKSNIASTLMACPDQQKEDNFKEMLSNINTYIISGNKLSLSKNKTAPFARFEAVNE